MPRRKAAAPGGSPITDRSPIEMPLAVFLACLMTVAAAAYGFQGAVTTAVRSQMNAYLTRAEFFQRIDQEDRQSDQHFHILQHELLQLGRSLK